MITLEEVQIMGIHAPRTHQRVIMRLSAELFYLYDKQKVTHLEPLPETMIDEDSSRPVPDIMLVDNEREETPVIIEITRTGSVKNDLKKIVRLIEESEYGIQEGFVYDYKLGAWHKYKRGVGNITENPSFCEAINLDLATLL
jgi:Uma2 family endonuclease